MPRATLLAFVLSLTLTAGCASRAAAPGATGEAPAPAARTTGTLFIVGGGSTPASVTEEFVRLAGGRTARIVVFAMASASGERSGEAKANDLRKLGATARNVWIDHAQADLDSVARLLDDATGVWFGGGDQNRLLDVLRDTKTARAITRRFQAGAVVGGTSAGAAVMSTPMITGTELLRRDTSETWTRVARGTVEVDSGLGLMTEAVVDQHFLRRRRHNRLLSLVLASAPHLGVGIDEGTALIVEPTGRWRVLGASAAFIVDAREASRTAASAQVLGAANMRFHLLPSGSTFDPRTGRATLPR